VTDDQRTLLGDRYLLGDVIGRGGMADVHRATDRLLSREVAVKVLRETTETESDRERFTTEARTLAGLNHPGLVTVLDAGIAAERPYLVMELVEGPSLSRACAGGPLDPDRVAEIGAEVADALASAHAQQVVHRDVKPGNVLLGSDGRVRLADFGIARLIGDTVRHTQTGHAIGTPAYLSPEQIHGDEVTPAVDIYSLGLVLIEALSGERPFPGTPAESALARLNRPPDVPPSLSDRWQTLLRAMTALEPADRPDAGEVAAALRALPAADADPTATQVLTQPVPTPAPAPAPAPTTATIPTAAPPPGPSFADRAGDAFARAGRDLGRRAGETPSHLRAVAAVIAAIVVLIVVVAIAANTGSPPDDVPSQTPDELEQPLQDLHDAVEGDG
jgi:serine/threonine protein kinase